MQAIYDFSNIRHSKGSENSGSSEITEANLTDFEINANLMRYFNMVGGVGG